jgi:hypothetical protein
MRVRLNISFLAYWQRAGVRGSLPYAHAPAALTLPLSQSERESPQSRHRKTVTESTVMPSNVALGRCLLWQSYVVGYDPA